MNEMIKEWLNELYDEVTELYDEEIKETKAAIANERIWANGADDPTLHCKNIETLEEYLEVLENLKEKTLN